MSDQPDDLLQRASAVLEMNDQGIYTIPAPDLYPHQWLWDSCFIAIGLRHLDVERAKTEVMSLLRGQWANGMLPNMVLNTTNRHVGDGNLWRSWSNPNSPDHVLTSGITQPPMLAEAIVQIGQKMKAAERRRWYKTVYPALLKYHLWLYNERDPHGEGLVLQVHPWETGLDNTPPWINELNEHQLPVWIRLIKGARLEWLINLFRRDTKHIPAEHRINVIDALAFFSIQRRLRRKRYEINRILTHSFFSIEDLTFNCILIRANQLLQEIAAYIKEEVPLELQESMAKSEAALSALWDPYSSQYYSRNFVTHRLLKEPSIATLMPLYAGCISKERAKQLVKMIENQHLFGTDYPVPSVPVSSEWFNPVAYWQGPTWINTNWLIIDGLKRCGFTDHAEVLKENTIDMVDKSGCYEYFNPHSGEPDGAANFSWTAALIIDMIKGDKK